MLDSLLLRYNLPDVVASLARRGLQIDADTIATVEAGRRRAQSKLQQLQQRRRNLAKEIGQARKSGVDTADLQKLGHELGEQIKTCETELDELNGQWHKLQLELPNMPHQLAPEGKDEDDNVTLRHVGEITTSSGPDHVSIGEQSGMMDFATATKIAGSRFVVLHRDLARLHRALGQFMLDLHIREHGYEEVNIPLLANPASLEGTGQLPKFADDLFAVEGGAFYLIPTAEVSVTNIVRDCILDPDKLPLRWVCHSMSFRREAGSYGRDTRGMIRQHQFEKVELVQVVAPEGSEQVHEQLTSHAERVLQELELPYRVVELCCGDLGFAASRTYDLEVWLPGQKNYREISSCSNFRDFQARRMRVRMRCADGGLEFVHTLNGSGLAVGRTLVAIMENYYQDSGVVAIPDALRPYMGGLGSIAVKASSNPAE